jgi:hypothetical protein
MVVFSFVGAVLATHTVCVAWSLRVTALDGTERRQTQLQQSCVAHRAEEGTADNRQPR